MRKSNTRKKEQAAAAVIPIGFGFDLPPDRKPQQCLTFARTHEIAMRISSARETELRHIRRCHSCNARFRAFERDLGSDPHHSVHQQVRHVVIIGLGGSGKAVMAPLLQMLATTGYTAYRWPEVTHGDDGHGWHDTHVLAHGLNYVSTLDHDVAEVWCRATEAALGHAASTYALSESVDDVWPLLEGLKEGAHAAVRVPHLASRYARLYAHVATEGPPLVRHALLLGLSELHDRGGESHHFARTALDHLFESRHAAEVAAACTLITRGAHRAAFINALEIERLHQRIARLAGAVKAALSSPRHDAAGEEGIDAMLHHTFEDRSPRSQIIGVLVAKRAFHDAFEDAHAHKVHHDRVRAFLSECLLRPRSMPAAWSLLTHALLASTAARRFPEAYAGSVLQAIRPHEVMPPAWTAHERHGLIASALEQYERGDLAPPRFEQHGGHWSAVHETPHPIDAFSRGLAALANEHHDYAFHLEWANARFDSTAHGSVAAHHEYAAR